MAPRIRPGRPGRRSTSGATTARLRRRLVPASRRGASNTEPPDSSDRGRIDVDGVALHAACTTSIRGRNPHDRGRRARSRPGVLRAAGVGGCVRSALGRGSRGGARGRGPRAARDGRYLVGRDADSADAWARAHHGFLQRGDAARAARCAFWLAFGLLIEGEPARSGGWLARGRRLLDDGQHDCVEPGYLLVPVALRALARGRRRDRPRHLRPGRRDRRALRRPGPGGVRPARPGARR